MNQKITAPPASLVCPGWCDSPTIHNGNETGSHAHDVLSGGDIEVSVLQRVDDGTWLVPVSWEPHASLFFGMSTLDDLSATVCRQLAAALSAAADKLDTIMAGDR